MSSTKSSKKGKKGKKSEKKDKKETVPFEQRPLLFKVSEKKAVSIYGLNRFPVTLYKDQMIRLLDSSDEIRHFINEHNNELASKKEKEESNEEVKEEEQKKKINANEKEEINKMELEIEIKPF
jgi:hypothetical protein